MTWGSATHHVRTCVAKPNRRYGRRKCKQRNRLGVSCTRPCTHYGQANGVTLTSGCEWCMRRWAKVGYER